MLCHYVLFMVRGSYKELSVAVSHERPEGLVCQQTECAHLRFYRLVESHRIQHGNEWKSMLVLHISRLTVQTGVHSSILDRYVVSQYLEQLVERTVFACVYSLATSYNRLFYKNKMTTQHGNMLSNGYYDNHHKHRTRASETRSTQSKSVANNTTCTSLSLPPGSHHQ